MCIARNLYACPKGIHSFIIMQSKSSLVKRTFWFRSEDVQRSFQNLFARQPNPRVSFDEYVAVPDQPNQHARRAILP